MDMKPFIILLVFIVSENDSANILGMFPVPSISHQVVFRKITQELAKRGHDLTVITPDPAYPKGGAPFNYNEIDVHDISYTKVRQFMVEQFKITGDVMTFNEIRQMSTFMRELVKTQMETKEVQELITKNKKIDLILIEALVRPAYIYSYIFKAPVILVSSFTAIFSNDKVVGSPTHPLLYPNPFRKRLYNLSLTENFKELYIQYSTELADYLNEQDENVFLEDAFGPQCPTINDLSNNVDMLLLNVHTIWADNQLVGSNVIYMGGIHQLPKKKLPKDLKDYLDSSKTGRIYVSFGTNALSDIIPQEKELAIMNVLSKLHYNILWKWDQDELPKTSSNIKTSKWLPQSDLLRHPNVKLFITQAGLQSTDEAITAGVPLVAIPMLGDQWYNAEKYNKFGIGIKLEIELLTEDLLENAIQTVIENDSYLRTLNKLRALLRDQPETSLNTTMWWIEYVLRHQGARHLRAPAANRSYLEYFEIKLCLYVILILLILIVVIIIVVVLLLKKIYKYVKVYTYVEAPISLTMLSLMVFILINTYKKK